ISMKLVPTLAALALSATSVSALALTSGERFGESADAADATRTIVVGDNTRWVNVDHREVVKLMINGQPFTWKFDGVPQAFDLRQIAPANSLTPPVRVYIGLTEDDVGTGS